MKTLLNGTVYDGQWDDGKFKSGKCNYPDGKIYEGEWLDGKPHGKGVKTWPDGRKYDGDWNQGKPIGNGRKIYPDGKVKEGYWENGAFVEGPGKYYILKFLGGANGTTEKNALGNVTLNNEKSRM